MRIFPIHSSFIYSQIDYWNFLNESTDGLKKYINHFKPRWKILNEPPAIYSHEELINKGIIKPMRILKKINTITNEQGNKTEERIYEQSLLIFPTRLKYNEGLINNFGQHYSSVYIYNGDPKNTDLWGVEIPREALPDEDAINIFTKAQLLIEPPRNGEVVLSSISVITPPKISFKKDGNITLNTDNLFLVVSYPSPETYQISSQAELNIAPDGKLQKLLPSYYVFSSFKSEGEDIDLKDKNNYRLVRTARGGGYYTWSYGWNGEGNDIITQYTENATDILGFKYVLDCNFQQKRFFLSDTEITKTQEKGYISFKVGANGDINFTIKSRNGSGWGGSDLINHEFFIETENASETIIMDEKREKSRVQIDSTGVPKYTVTFAQPLDDFKTNINLW